MPEKPCRTERTLASLAIEWILLTGIAGAVALGLLAGWKWINSW